VDALFVRFSNDFVMICVYLVLALSLNLINGYAGLFSLGHAGFWAVGAYSGSAFVVYMHQAAPAVPGWVLFAAGAIVAVTAAAVVGLAVGLPCLRLRGDYLAIATLGFSLIVVNVLNNLDVVGGSRSFPFAPLSWPEGAIYDLRARSAHAWVHAILGILAVTLCAFVIARLRHSRHGRAIVSLREDEIASELCGVNVVKYKLFVFMLGASFAGLAGILYATYSARITPETFGFMEGVKILLMVVLGGMGSISGTFVAVIVLYEVPELLRLSRITIAGEPIADWWVIIYALLLVGLMILRPQGLLGSREFRDIWRARRTAPPAGDTTRGAT
jgi:branched-chain amino acid transport system permease protein